MLRVKVLLLGLTLTFNSDIVKCDPVSIPSQSSSSSGSTWTIRAIPHQNSNVYTTLTEQVQNLKYNWESGIDHLTRKLEMLESKISRLDTSNQLRLEKLTESVNSKEIKDELAMEQLIRKLDSNYERLNHKLSYMEARLETTLNKIQTNLDNGLNRIEIHQNDMDTELTDINQSVEDIKLLTIQMDDKHNMTQKSMQHHLQTLMSESASRDQLDKLTGTIQNIGVKLNDTNYTINSQNLNQNDASGQSGLETEKIIITLKSEIDRESHRIENKISNMYNDLWRRFMSLEMTVKTVLTFGNTTRRQLQEDMRMIIQQIEKQHSSELDSQENYLEIVMDAVMNTVQELQRKVDSNFQMMLTSQNLFMDNCHRLQLEEPQLESKISIVLEKILNTITNKTMRVDNRLVEAMEMIKSHQSQVMRSLGHTTKMVVGLTEENNQESKHFEAALMELAERNEIVAVTLQELQEEIQMLSNITSIKFNNEIEEWFNKTIINEEKNHFDNTDYNNHKININNNKKGINENVDIVKEDVITEKPIIQSSTSTPQLLIPTKEIKKIKFADSEDVIRIFTDDLNYINNNNSSDESNINDKTGEDYKTIKDNTKRISIIIPKKYYNNHNVGDGDENFDKIFNNSEFYKLLLQELMNQTGEPINGDDIGAIILNTESDKQKDETMKKIKTPIVKHNNDNENFKMDNLNLKINDTIMDFKLVKKLDRYSLKNNQQQNMTANNNNNNNNNEIPKDNSEINIKETNNNINNRSSTYNQIQESKNLNRNESEPDEKENTNKNATTTPTDKLQNNQTSIYINTNTKPMQNITELIKSRLDLYKNQNKYKSDININNKKNEQISLLQTTNQNNVLRKLLQQYNEKRKNIKTLPALSKYSNIYNELMAQNENISATNINDNENNNKNSMQQPSSRDEIDVAFPEVINPNELKYSSSEIPSYEDLVNNNSSFNLFENIKGDSGNTNDDESSNIYGTDQTREEFPNY